MKRLTTDHPEGNFGTVLNFVYGKDGMAYLRSDGERDDVPVHEWAKKQCIARGCDEFPGETLEEIDEAICECGFYSPDCLVHLAYIFACQAVHLRDRLKMYEDTGLMPDKVERLAAQEANAPLTLEELRKMDGEPVWVKSIDDDALFAPKGGAIVTVLDNGDVSLGFLGEDTYWHTWVLSEDSDDGADEEDEIMAVYRWKPEE